VIANQLLGNAPDALRLEGALQVEAAEQLLKSLPMTAACYQVSLKGVSAVDSAGLALLLDWQHRLNHAGGELVISDIPESLQRLAQIGGVDALLSRSDNGVESMES
jgi:phospholipid transport system transporter-binding protein